MRVNIAERPLDDPLFASPDGPLTPPLYNRLSESPLGDVDAPIDDEQFRCFNCSELGHRLQECTERRNRERVASARMRFETEGQLHSPWGSLTGHSSVEQRLAMLTAFTPGEVRGSVLRDALGLVDFRDRGHNAPWLANMAEWGYPPGWCTSYDPMAYLRHHVAASAQDHTASKLFIFGDTEVELLDLDNNVETAKTTTTPECDDVTRQDASNVDRASYVFPSRRRWVFYPFSDDLPLYNGHHLPSIGINVTQIFVPQPFYPIHPSLIVLPQPPPPSLPPPPPPPDSPPPLPPSSSPPPLPRTSLNILITPRDTGSPTASDEGEMDMEMSSDSDS